MTDDIFTTRNIPDNLRVFMLDQHNERNLTISEHPLDALVQATTIPNLPQMSHDPTYEPSQISMEVDEFFLFKSTI